MHIAPGQLSSAPSPFPPFTIQEIELDVGTLTYVQSVNGSDSFIDSPSPHPLPLDHLPGSTGVSPPLSEVPLVS